MGMLTPVPSSVHGWTEGSGGFTAAVQPQIGARL